MEKNNINEELNRYKLLSTYAPNKTVKENMESIDSIDDNSVEIEENILFGTARMAGKKIVPALDDIVKMASQRGKTPLSVLDTAAPGGSRAALNGDDLLKALKAGSVDASNLARINVGMFKASGVSADILTSLASDIVKQKEFIKQYSQLAKSPAKLKATLRQKGYSEAGADALIAEIKKTKNWGGVKSPKTKTTPTTGTVQATTNNGLVKNLKTTLGKVGDISATMSRQLIDGIRNKGWNWKKILMWTVLGGGSVAAVWYFMFRNKLATDDMPEEQPKDDGKWLPCVKDLLTNKKGVLKQTKSGQIFVHMKETSVTEYDDKGGLRFYSNGRVFVDDNSKRGNWSCSGSEVEVNESLNEQDVAGIDISWDGEKQDGGLTPPPKTNTPITYTECKGFPLTYGCKSEEIKKIQVCIGLPGEYQTGNYGPITMKALGGLKEVTKEKYDEIIKKCEGGQGPVTGSTSGSTSGSTVTSGTTTGNTTTVTGTTTGSTTGSTVTTGETPSDLYARLVKAKTLVGRLRGRRIVYKGPDLTKEEREKLEAHMTKMGYRVSRDNFDYRKGDKIIFKRNKEEDTTEPTGVTQEPTK